MTGRREFSFYLSVCIGMALATSSFLVMAGLFETGTLLWVLVALSVSGALCMVMSLSIAELAGMYPSSPAIRTYFKSAFGNRTSLVFVYLYLSFVVVMAGVESYVFSRAAGAIFQGLPSVVTILTLLAAVLAVNLFGLELPRGLQVLFAFVAVATIVVIGILGVFREPSAARSLLQEQGGSATDLPALIGLSVFLYMGFEWVTPLGLRPRSYDRKIPLAMPVSIGLLMITYAMFALGLASTLPRAVIGEQITPQVPYFTALLGRSGAYLAGLLSIAAIFSTFNAGVMGGSRLILVLSHEGSLPAWCGTMGQHTGAPVGAVLLLGGLVTVFSMLVLALRIEFLAAIVGSSTICIVYAGYMLAARRLRTTAPERRRPFRTPVPAGIQWGVIGLLLLVGVASLTSLPQEGIRPAVGLVVMGVTAFTLSGWSVRRTTVPASSVPASVPAPS